MPRARPLPPDAALRARTDAVLGDALYWFPVRHHSPAVARHLEAAILARRPRLVLIEGPYEANDLIPHLTDTQTRPPVAIYCSYCDDDNVLGLAGVASPAEHIPARFSCWYPLLSYSPEYVALLAARRVGAEALFIDLPHSARVKHEEPQQAGEDSSERLIVDSDFYRRLASAAGYRTWDEAWDSLFEIRDYGGDCETFRRELAGFCAAVRATLPPERMAHDGTVDRERFMTRTIREALAQRRLKPEQAMVVCGGLHLFLDRDDSRPPPEPPPGTVYTTIVPYSFFRVSELSGYAAGNRAPQFYQTAWDLTRAGRAADVLIEHVVAVLKEARREGEPVSSADAIAVCQHAALLARLRGRPAPVLDDVHDAIITCCCKGDPREDGVHLRRAIDAADIGNQLGRVTAALGRLPIVNDFYAQLSDLDLVAVMGREKKSTVELDKRDEAAARRSVFLHRLRYLGVPLAVPAQAPAADFATGTIFREEWALRWSPGVEAALVELNLYGDTIESASLAKLREELARDEPHAGRTCRRLVAALDMDLPDMVREAERACGRAIDNDARFVSLTEALASLRVIDRYAVLRNMRRDRLDELVLRCYDRACFSILDVIAVPEEQQGEVVAALLSLAEATLRGDRQGLDRDLFAEHVRKAAGLTTAPFLRGAFLGLLTELREKTAEELAAELSALARAPADRMVTAGDLLDGILAVSRTSILLGAGALVGAVDDLLRAADWDAYLTMVPRLRAAFERLHAAQRDSLAGRVAERYGLAEAEELTDLRTSVAVAARIARIDRRVAEIMKEWDL